MTHRLLCKLGVHKYELKMNIEYCFERKITGVSDIFKRKIKEYKIFEKCKYCGKIKEKNDEKERF